MLKNALKPKKSSKVSTTKRKPTSDSLIEESKGEEPIKIVKKKPVKKGLKKDVKK